MSTSNNVIQNYCECRAFSYGSTLQFSNFINCIFLEY